MFLITICSLDYLCNDKIHAQESDGNIAYSNKRLIYATGKPLMKKWSDPKVIVAGNFGICKDFIDKNHQGLEHPKFVFVNNFNDYEEYVAGKNNHSTSSSSRLAFERTEISRITFDFHI